MARRRRIWCELIAPEELAAPATLDLLERYALEPIVALPPAGETTAMAKALRALGERRLRVGLWPLLEDEHGYWPSEHNADRFVARAHEALDFAANAGARATTLAIDLEPPLEVTGRLMRGPLHQRGLMLWRSFNELRRPGDVEVQRAAAERFRGLGRELAARDVETLAAVLPMVVLDLASSAPIWQAVLRTPVARPSWRVVSPMMYTSLIADALPSKSRENARAILFELGRTLVRCVGSERASMSVGLVGPGKLGDEPHLTAPAELAADVAAARAAGVDDLALFSLESVLARGPEPWLDAFTETQAQAPAGLRTQAVSGLVRAAVWALRPLSLVVAD